jgi:hypothetical protein
VKFGFPMAYSATVLAMGMVDFAAGYASAGETQNAMRNIKWATDYFMKVHEKYFIIYRRSFNTFPFNIYNLTPPLPSITYYWTGLQILDRSYLAGNLTDSKIAETKALEPLKS